MLWRWASLSPLTKLLFKRVHVNMRCFFYSHIRNKWERGEGRNLTMIPKTVENDKTHHRLNHKEIETRRKRTEMKWLATSSVSQGSKEKEGLYMKLSDWTETLLLVSKFWVNMDQNACVKAASLLWGT